jgi:hypothetical protein
VDTDTDGPPRFGGGSKNSSMERNRDSRNFYNNNGDRGNAPYSGRSSGSGQGSRNSSRARDDSGGRGGPSRSLQAPPRHQQVPVAPVSSSMSFSGAVKKEGGAVAPSKPLTREDVDKNYNAMLAVVNAFREDKLNSEDAMTKLKPLSINKDVLVEIYNKFLDRKDIDRENLMLLVCELVKTKKVSREDNCAAFVDILEFAPDMMCDVPRVYEYIAQFLGEFPSVRSPAASDSVSFQLSSSLLPFSRSKKSPRSSARTSSRSAKRCCATSSPPPKSDTAHSVCRRSSPTRTVI